jgi:hypothetical protein
LSSEYRRHFGAMGQSMSSESLEEVDAPSEVVEFIRYCYRRRGIGWPELYDEMCCAAARGSYRGMDYDQLARLGISFCLDDLPKLWALANRVVAEERAARRPALGAAPQLSAAG